MLKYTGSKRLGNICYYFVNFAKYCNSVIAIDMTIPPIKL